MFTVWNLVYLVRTSLIQRAHTSFLPGWDAEIGCEALREDVGIETELS